MALFDIFKRGLKKPAKKQKERLKRPPKGVLKTPASLPGQSAGAKATAGKPALKTEEKKDKKEEKKLGKSELASMVILRPHVTEKSTVASEIDAYTFVVSSRANKVMVRRAVHELYGFKPKKVRMLNMPSKPRRVRGIKGTKSGYKKAVVYLKKGDKIELV